MAEYVETVVGILLCVGLCSHLLPEDGNGKCAQFAAGLLVLYVVCSPLLHIGRWEIQTETFSEQTLSFAEADYVADTFEKLLAERVKEQLSLEQMGDFLVEAEAEQENGQITGVAEIFISPYTQEVATYISSYLGIDVEKVVELCRN